MEDLPSRRALILCPFPPRLDGHDGGSRVLGNVLAELAEQHELAVLYLRGDGEPPADPSLRGSCAHLEGVPLASSTASGLARPWAVGRRVVGGLAGTPAWALHVRSEMYRKRLATLAATFAPDVIHAEFAVMARYLTPSLRPAAARVLVVHEPGTSAAVEILAQSTGPRRLLRRVELRAWRHFERRALGRADAAIVFTERDGRDLARMAPGTSIHIVPLGVRLPPSPSDATGVEPPEVCFVGNFKHPPNVAAAWALRERIMPEVWIAHPRARLVIVGPSPPPALGDPNDTRILVAGGVPDVMPYLDRAAVVVAPLWSGGGMRVKVLEALAAGKAVVASRRAVEGLAVRDAEHLLIRDEYEPFAAAIGRLLDDAAFRATLARAGRLWAAERLGWSAVAASVATVWTEAILARSNREGEAPGEPATSSYN
jgi:glycosyltransferase involved in cell wall biosynthesis